ncbi:3-isopropylmalate dehydratase [Oxyplasma meridianum]|uniref:3-isopropylmalate dehydratase n=1 Tax=Oxyplasma meridianum TaxID=3073602 RepID=A0AAX4NFD6_9ARCH
MARVFLMGNDIDTDTIAPGGYLHLPLEQQMSHCLESVYPNFSHLVRVGDVVVAGENFGSGSSREQAPLILKRLGIRMVLAKSFSRLFFRNAINVGLYPGILKDTSAFRDGEEVQIDMENHRVISSGGQWIFMPLSGIALDIINSGGMVEFARTMVGKN